MAVQASLFDDSLLVEVLAPPKTTMAQPNNTDLFFDPGELIKWSAEEIDKLRCYVLKMSLHTLTDARASNAVRDDVWMWFRQDQFDESFSYFTCALTYGVNPTIFRSLVFITMEGCRRLLKHSFASLTEAEHELLQWLDVHRVVSFDANVSLTALEEHAFRLSFTSFPREL